MLEFRDVFSSFLKYFLNYFFNSLTLWRSVFFPPLPLESPAYHPIASLLSAMQVWVEREFQPWRRGEQESRGRAHSLPDSCRVLAYKTSPPPFWKIPAFCQLLLAELEQRKTKPKFKKEKKKNGEWEQNNSLRCNSLFWDALFWVGAFLK